MTTFEKLSQASSFKEAMKYSIKWIEEQMNKEDNNKDVNKTTPEHVKIVTCNNGIKLVGDLQGCVKNGLKCETCIKYNKLWKKAHK